MNSDDFLDQIESDEEDLYRSFVKPVHPVRAKIFFWLVTIGGIAVGVCLFLFFITIFLYVFLPILFVSMIWLGITEWKFNRDWKKIEKKMQKWN